MTRLIGAGLIWMPGLGLGLAQAVPDGVLKRRKGDPQAYLDLAADLIHGFGGAQGLDRDAIAAYVALERAEAPARALRRRVAVRSEF